MIGDPNLHTRGVDTTTQSVGTEVQYLDCRKQGSLVLYLCAGWVVGVCGCGCGCVCELRYLRYLKKYYFSEQGKVPRRYLRLGASCV